MDIQTSVCTTVSTDDSVVAENPVSAQRTPSAEACTTENIASNQREMRVESGRSVQVNERTQEKNDVYRQATLATQP